MSETTLNFEWVRTPFILFLSVVIFQLLSTQFPIDFQIQMLLQVQAQQAAATIPSGVMTPPTTPTSNPPTNQAVSTPANQQDTSLNKDYTANGSTPRPVSHHSPPTRLVGMSTSPTRPGGVGCSVGVNTGQSLFWSPESKSRKSLAHDLSSERRDGSSKQYRYAFKFASLLTLYKIII